MQDSLWKLPRVVHCMSCRCIELCVPAALPGTMRDPSKQHARCKWRVFFASSSGCMVLSKWHVLILEGADFVGKGPAHK